VTVPGLNDDDDDDVDFATTRWTVDFLTDVGDGVVLLDVLATARKKETIHKN